MSSPFADRLRLAADATGANRPEMATTLANSDLGNGDIQMVGGFTKALDDATLVRLTRAAGARLDLNSDQTTRLDAIGENYADVHKNADNGDTRNWLEKVTEGFANVISNTGNFLMNNPVTDTVLQGFDFLNDVAHLPARMISSALDGSNDNEITDQMKAGGYDPNSAWDYVQFMTTQGSSLYHDLDGLRQTHGDRLVDLAVEMNADPEGFASRLGKKPPEIQQLVNSDEFAKVADLVDRQHISPGRDVARLITGGHTDNAFFTAVSGVLDAAYTLMADPTLMAGKVARGVRALDVAGNAITPASRLSKLSGVTALTKAADKVTGGKYRAGLRNALDQDGIRGLLKEGTAVGNAANGFLKDAKLLRETEDKAAKGAIYARMNALYKPWMPLLDEVNGTRVLQHQFTDVESARRVMQDLQDSKGVAEAVHPPIDSEWLDAGLKHLSKIKLADSFEKRQSYLRIVAHHTGRELEIDPKVVADVSRGSRARFEQAVREKAAETPALPPVPTMPVPEGAAFDRKLVDSNGIGWLAQKADPIENLDEFANYMADTAGFLRFAHGAAAKREIYLPGRVSLTARLMGAQAAARAGKGGLIFDHTKPYRHMPNEAEEGIQQQLDDGTLTAGDVMHNMRTKGTADGEGYNPIRKARAKWEQRARRVSSLTPSVDRIDLTAAGGTEQVRRLARLYINKAEADRLAGLYAVSDLGRRREIVAGINEQLFHASGLSRSEDGLAFMEKFRADQQGLDKRAYGLHGTDVVKTDAGDRHVALLPSQLSEEVLIPSFKDLQYLASKFVVGGHLARTAGTIRAGLNSELVDGASHAIKAGWITSGAGGLRNAGDEVVGAALTGGGLQLLKGRAMLSKATTDVRGRALAERRRAAILEGKLLPRIPIYLRGKANKMNDVFMGVGLGHVLSFKKDADLLAKDGVYAAEAAEDMQAGLINEALTGTFFADELPQIMGEDGVARAAEHGLMSSPVRFNGNNVKHEFDGYKMVEVDGGVGLDGFVNNLGQAFQDLTSPAHVALKGLTTPGHDVLADVVDYMHTPTMRHFLENAEAFKWTRDGKAVASHDDLEQAIEHYSERLIAHTAMLVSGRGELIASADEAAGAAARWENDTQGIARQFQERYANDVEDPDYQGLGPINADLVEMLQKGTIPDRTWVKDNMATEELPTHVVQKTWRPLNPQHVVGQIAQGYTGMLSKAYKVMVTDQVNAISRNPMYTAAYVQARHNIAPYEDFLKEQGFSEEIAQNMSRRMARRQAEELVTRMVDDPTQATQYAVVARNFHAFARAQEDWLRRWGRIMKDDPTVIRKGQLAIHGAESAGLVEKDDQGNLIFTYPGSGMVLTAFNRVSKIFGVDHASVPMMPDLKSQLMFLNPSLDNPLGFSAMPVISIPFHALAAVTGSDLPLLTASMDKVVNGQLGAGRAWYQQMLPGFANRIISGVLGDGDPASQWASAYTGALMNMSAAGRLDELNLNDASALANFQHDLKSQITNQMVARALFGFFAPAAPGMPTNDVKTKDGHWVSKPDFVYHKMGISTLKDEARKVFSTMPYEQALAYWTKVHPGELIYAQGEVARTQVGMKDAQAFATMDAAKYMQDNPYLFDKYGHKGGVASFFIPQGTTGTPGGEFSQVAYRAQLEQGIREYKSVDEYFNDLVIQRGEAIYYHTKDDYDAEIKTATANGDLARVKQLQDEWSVQAQLIKDTNPLMADKFAAYATSGVQRRQTLTQLNQLLGDQQAVTALGDQAAGVAQLMLAERDYTAGRQSVAGKRGPQATAQRADLDQQYQAQVKAVVDRFPGLGDLARGVFRVPN